MKLYRISSAAYIQDLTGTGAKLHGGRWNDIGTPMLYAAESISLATLEILVHFDGLTVPPLLHLLHLNLPDKYIQEVDRTTFDKIRKRKDAEFAFKEKGEKWVKSGSSLALKVPSIIISQEYNVIINTRHSDLSKLEKIKSEALDLDTRLFK